MTLSSEQHNSIDQLLRTWRAHDDLRRSDASIPELFRSHQRLSDARMGVRAAH